MFVTSRFCNNYYNTKLVITQVKLQNRITDTQCIYSYLNLQFTTINFITAHWAVLEKSKMFIIVWHLQRSGNLVCVVLLLADLQKKSMPRCHGKRGKTQQQTKESGSRASRKIALRIIMLSIFPYALYNCITILYCRLKNSALNSRLL